MEAGYFSWLSIIPAIRWERKLFPSDSQSILLTSSRTEREGGGLCSTISQRRWIVDTCWPPAPPSAAPGVFLFSCSTRALKASTTEFRSSSPPTPSRGRSKSPKPGETLGTPRISSAMEPIILRATTVQDEPVPGFTKLSGSRTAKRKFLWGPGGRLFSSFIRSRSL